MPPVSGNETGPSLILIEAGLTLVCIAIALALPRLGSSAFAPLVRAFHRLARRRRLSVASVGAAALLLRLAILHRLGRVPLGQPSVLIAVSTPHRAEAFDACRWIIDQLKKDLTIWKQEIWQDGQRSWVHPTPSSPPTT